jgi:hypothetical protein
VVIGYSARHERGDRPSSFAGMPDKSESFLRYPDETKTSLRGATATWQSPAVCGLARISHQAAQDSDKALVALKKASMIKIQSVFEHAYHGSGLSSRP